MPKIKRVHNPNWKDTTQAHRQSKRRAELEAAAKRDGFQTASEAITAWKNGKAILIRK